MQIIFYSILNFTLRFAIIYISSIKGNIMQKNDINAVEITDSAKKDGNRLSEDKLSNRNLFMYAFGTLGRDFLYNLFNGYLLSFCVFTKSLNTAQFSAITIIIVLARIFDAFNDPIMGGIVENTRTKWGKYKPWQLIGCLTTGVVILVLFNVPAQGWAFIGLLAAMYFLFSITFTMNDISYWGMMPTLTSNAHDRDKLMTVTQISVSIGGGLAGLIIPTFAMGDQSDRGQLDGGFRDNVRRGGGADVRIPTFHHTRRQRKAVAKKFVKTPPMKLKDMFRVLFKNDQLLWSALVMLLFNIGTNVVGGGLGMMYVYFDNAYNGTLWMVFGLGFAAVSVIFTLFYPALSKKYGRDKLLYSCGFAIIIGYALMMILGLTVPKIVLFEVLGMTITLRFLMTFFAYTIAGWGSGFYMIMVINMANTVEYNEYRTGKRDEGLIFALRPFTAKMGSALMQGLVSLVYIIAGVLTYTNRLTAIDRNLSTETREMVIADVQANGQNSIKILLVCTCIIPIVFMIAAMLIYKKKYFLNETKMTQMLAEINARKEEEISDEISDEQAELALVEDEIANGDVESEEEKEVLDEIAGGKRQFGTNRGHRRLTKLYEGGGLQLHSAVFVFNIKNTVNARRLSCLYKKRIRVIQLIKI